MKDFTSLYDCFGPVLESKPCVSEIHTFVHPFMFFLKKKKHRSILNEEDNIQYDNSLVPPWNERAANGVLLLIIHLVSI